MMKKPSLFAPAMPVATAPESIEAEAVIASKRPPSRQGKRALTVYLPPEAWKQLRMLAVNLEMSTQDLGSDAINLLFEKHRLNRIA